MPKFLIEETIPCVQVFLYEVEASSETEALNMVLDSKIESVEVITAEHDYDKAQYEIEESE